MLGIRHWQGIAIDLFCGDITEFVCDAMVNAANVKLAGGGGVDGAIHRAAGSGLMEECLRIGGCKTGEAVATASYQLPCEIVVHAVGPVWQGGSSGEKQLLESAVRSSLSLADGHGLRHIALPAISTGIYGYPVAEAAQASLSTVKKAIDELTLSSVKRVTFVLFSEEIYATFQQHLFEIFPE